MVRLRGARGVYLVKLMMSYMIGMSKFKWYEHQKYRKSILVLVDLSFS